MLILTFTSIFDTYLLVFLLYLNYNFAKNKTSSSIKDPVLGKDVPFVVFIKNKKLH